MFDRGMLICLLSSRCPYLSDGARLTLQEILYHILCNEPAPKLTELSEARGKAISNIQEHMAVLKELGIIKRDDVTGQLKVKFMKLYSLMKLPPGTHEALKDGGPQAAREAFRKYLHTYSHENAKPTTVPEALRVRDPMERFLRKRVEEYEPVDIGRYFKHHFYQKTGNAHRGLSTKDIMKCKDLKKQFGAKTCIKIMDWFFDNRKRLSFITGGDLTEFYWHRDRIAAAMTMPSTTHFNHAKVTEAGFVDRSRK